MRAALTSTFFCGLVSLCGLAALALASDGPVADEVTPWEDVKPTKLWKAVAAGAVEASGRNPRSYRQVELTVVSKSKKRIVVDTGGSHLRPRRRGSCQRLGLGPPVVASAAETGEKGQVLLRIEPGDTTTLTMNTVCLDAGRPGPNTHRFEGVASPLPPVREKVLRWWIENPDAPQSAVNSAIWRNRSRVVVGKTHGNHRRMEHIRIAAAHGGVYFQLKNKELTSLDADAVRRVMGSQIDLMFPTDDAVYAVMPGEDRNPDLWRFAPTGENPWGFVTDLDPNAELLGLVSAGGGNLVLLTSEHVALYSHATKETKKLIPLKTDQHLSARRTRSGQVDVTVHDPRDNGITRGGAIEGQSAGRFEVWRIDPERGTTDMRDRSWNVSAIRAGEAGIFGLSHKGVLRRFTRGKYKDIGTSDAYLAVVAVGRELIWLLDDRERLVAASATTGRALFRSPAKVSKEMWFSVDGVTDELVFATRKGFRRIGAKDGSVEEVAEMPDPPRQQEDADSADDE